MINSNKLNMKIQKIYKTYKMYLENPYEMQHGLFDVYN